ncbi:MAG: hypothetical protein AAGM46_27625, partial [Cyanobacteria bacterium J06582_2]
MAAFNQHTKEFRIRLLDTEICSILADIAISPNKYPSDLHDLSSYRAELFKIQSSLYDSNLSLWNLNFLESKTNNLAATIYDLISGENKTTYGAE